MLASRLNSQVLAVVRVRRLHHAVRRVRLWRYL